MMQGSLAERLRILRARKGLTLTEASERIGITRHTLRSLERGGQEPHYPTLRKIADGYSVPVEELLEEPVPLGKAPESGSTGERSEEDTGQLNFNSVLSAEQLHERAEGVASAIKATKAILDRWNNELRYAGEEGVFARERSWEMMFAATGMDAMYNDWKASYLEAADAAGASVDRDFLREGDGAIVDAYMVSRQAYSLAEELNPEVEPEIPQLAEYRLRRRQAG